MSDQQKQSLNDALAALAAGHIVDDHSHGESDNSGHAEVDHAADPPASQDPSAAAAPARPSSPARPARPSQPGQPTVVPQAKPPVPAARPARPAAPGVPAAPPPQAPATPPPARTRPSTPVLLNTDAPAQPIEIYEQPAEPTATYDEQWNIPSAGALSYMSKSTGDVFKHAKRNAKLDVRQTAIPIFLTLCGFFIGAAIYIYSGGYMDVWDFPAAGTMAIISICLGVVSAAMVVFLMVQVQGLLAKEQKRARAAETEKGSGAA